MFRAVAIVLPLLFPLSACDVGELSDPGGGAGGADAGSDTADASPNAPDAIPPNYTLSVTPPSVETTLGTEQVFTVELSSINFAGPATLAAAGAPDSWVVAFDPPVVNVQLDGVATAAMTVTVPTNAEAMNAQLQVEAVAAPGQRSTLATVNVANEVIVSLPAGVGANAHPFPAPLQIRLGAQVTIANEDGVLHRIHSDNGNEGFSHQDDDMSQGQAYSFTITQAGSYNYYCHIHDVAAGVGRIETSNP